MNDYDAQKALAELSLKIMEGRRELEALNNEKKSFLEQREAEAFDLVTKAYEKAKSVLDETKRFDEQIASMLQIAYEIVSDVQQVRNDQLLAKEAYESQIEDLKATATEKIAFLSKQEKELTQKRLILEKDTAMLEQLRGTVAKEQEKVTKDRMKLRRAIEIQKYGDKR